MGKQKLKVGEWVQFLNEVGGGTLVSHLRDGRFLIKDADGFENPYSPSELVFPLDDEPELMPEMREEEKTLLIKDYKQGLNEFEGIRIGDFVRPLDEEGEGFVKHISDKGVCKVDMNYDLTIEFARNELVKVEEGSDGKMLDSTDNESNLIKPEDLMPKSSPVKSKKMPDVWEIDLHVHEITEETDFLGPAELLRIQLDYFEMKLNEAIKSKVRKVIFIHGKGKGKLKTELRLVLKRYPNCAYHDGNFQRYGQGATEVHIWNK